MCSQQNIKDYFVTLTCRYATSAVLYKASKLMTVANVVLLVHVTELCNYQMFSAVTHDCYISRKVIFY